MYLQQKSRREHAQVVVLLISLKSKRPVKVQGSTSVVDNRNQILSIFISLMSTDRKAIKVMKSFNPRSASEHSSDNCTLNSSPANIYNSIC